MNVRYVTDVPQRSVIRHSKSRIILENIRKSPDIQIASETMELTVKNVPGEKRP
jgi:small-conductance mechanosensitive channel